MSGDLRTIRALTRRALNEILRVPTGALPGVLAPTIFMLGLSAVFGQAAHLRGFHAPDFRTFIVPVGLLQGAGFTGAATGVNLARDIELGWFDRMLVSRTPRWVLLASTVASASLRALLPISFTLAVGFAIGANWPGIGGLLIAILCACGFAAIIASLACSIALHFKTQAAAPLMQASAFVLALFTPAYAPQQLLTGWLQHVAKVNPTTKVLEAVRQGFVGDVTWATTWPALVVLAAGLALTGGLALRGLNRMGV
ncbi:MAG: type transport system permease protein [Thermoleophilaceae bacterium]|nr:type transport system permease protein [Thermoleophilaceae bacterium]